MTQENWLLSTHRWLSSEYADSAPDTIADSLAASSLAEIDVLVAMLIGEFTQLCSQPRRLRLLLQLVASRVLQLVHEHGGSEHALLSSDSLGQLYDLLSEVEPTAAAHVLQILAAQADEESLTALAQLLVDSPPSDWQLVGLSLSPLWKAVGLRLQLFFDRLEDGFVHPTTMAVLLDLANHSVRTNRLSEHPWSARQGELAKLLDQVVIRLEQLEKEPTRFGDRIEVVQQVLADSIALTVSLCDSLGLMRSEFATKSLKEALSLSHRRIQTEAAGALARLGDQEGIDRLIGLASDPVARSRSVAYAEELGLAEIVPEELRYPQALAESDLAAWLASPQQFGIPPIAMEHIETRTLYWPGYDEPRDCFLFRYQYQFPNGQFSNIGIAGPVAHAFQADLNSLAVDDIYAAFAGWHAEHEEIFEVPVNLLNSAQRREADRLSSVFELAEYEVLSGVALTFLLGEFSLLAHLKRDGQRMIGITDGNESVCFPVTDSPTALTPEVVLAIYRGRKLLRSFNID